MLCVCLVFGILQLSLLLFFPCKNRHEMTEIEVDKLVASPFSKYGKSGGSLCNPYEISQILEYIISFVGPT